MPLNGSGAYAPPSPQFPAIPNTLILASDYNAVLNDVAAALSQAVFRDGQGAFTGNQSMGGFKLTNMAVGTADTDAVRKSQLLALFPIGAVYITTTNTNPGTFLGGTWMQIAQGRVLIGVGTLGEDTYAAGATGGASTVTLSAVQMPSHTHTGTTGVNSVGHTHSGTTESSGAHTHDVLLYQGSGGSVSAATAVLEQPGASGSDQLAITLSNRAASAGAHTHTFATGGNSVDHTHSFTTASAGSDSAHENRPPYFATYFWNRTA
ncbi:MAG: hypothetical protein ABFD89_26475 [Bryobacteraceae bacterium]